MYGNSDSRLTIVNISALYIYSVKFKNGNVKCLNVNVKMEMLNVKCLESATKMEMLKNL